MSSIPHLFSIQSRIERSLSNAITIIVYSNQSHMIVKDFESLIESCQIHSFVIYTFSLKRWHSIERLPYSMTKRGTFSGFGDKNKLQYAHFNITKLVKLNAERQRDIGKVIIKIIIIEGLLEERKKHGEKKQNMQKAHEELRNFQF